MNKEYIIHINGEIINCIHSIYVANIEQNSTKKKIKLISKNNKLCKCFSKPETDKTISKLYIVKNLKDNKIIYIGQTNQSINSRLWQGLNPISNSGYHGYKWQNNEEIEIHCITSDKISKIELEAIEAELVYQHRKEKKCWPEFQTEIHFYNNEKAVEIAKRLYKEVIK